jgi:hypothetical protein
MSTSTSPLVNLTSETNKIILDAIAANNRRSVAYAKGVWGVVSRPYPGKDLKVNVGETFERVEHIVDLTLGELETTSKSSIELAEELMQQAAKAREESLAAARTMAKTGVATIKHVLETTEERLAGLAERLEESLDKADAQKAATAG